MVEPRADALAARLEKGRNKTFEIFDALKPEQWQQTLYTDPTWQVRQLMAHFVSSEDQLFALAQDVAAGGPGAPPGFDYDGFNASEQSRLEGVTLPELRAMLINPGGGPSPGSKHSMLNSWIGSATIQSWAR